MIIMHPRDYRRLRNLCVLRLELGDRATRTLLGLTAYLLVTEMFDELAPVPQRLLDTGVRSR